jgi:hypothetical protein
MSDQQTRVVTGNKRPEVVFHQSAGNSGFMRNIGRSQAMRAK